METLGPKGYQRIAIEQFVKTTKPRGMRCLEIGGSNLPPEYIASTVAPAQWVCVDYISSDVISRIPVRKHNEYLDHLSKVGVHRMASTTRCPEEPYVVFADSVLNLDARVLGEFDLVFSVAAFEHVHGLKEALMRIWECMKKGAALWSTFSPIWSSAQGHHHEAYLNARRPRDAEQGLGRLPDFAHLLRSRQEIAGWMEQFYERPVVDATIEALFDSDYINRLFFDEYRDIFQRSQFSNVEFSGVWPSRVREEDLQQLSKRYPTHSGFEFAGIRVIARK